MEASAPHRTVHRARAARVAAARAVGRRPDALRRRGVLLHAVPLRVLLPALARREQRPGRSAPVHPSIGLGVAIALALVLSGVAAPAGVARPAPTVRAAIAALRSRSLAIVLQVIDWTTLGFGAASGGIRECVHRLDLAVRGARARMRLLDRDAGRDALARRGGRDRGVRGDPPDVAAGASRRARSSGRSTSRSACWRS